MHVDLEKQVNLVDAFKMIVKLSEKYLDIDSTNDLKRYFDNAIIFVEDDELKNLGSTSNLINHLISQIPKRIERLSELKAPQCVIDAEIAVLLLR